MSTLESLLASIPITTLRHHRFVSPTRAIAGGRGAFSERSGVLVLLEDDRGNGGIGEASPLPGYSSESVDDCERAISNWLPTRSIELPSAARFAIETALVDLAGQRAGVPVFRLLSCRAEAARVEVNELLDLTVTLDDLTERAASALRRGVRTVKIKVGRPDAWDAELGALVSLRRSFGPALRLRLDAGGAWGLDDARRHLAELAPVEPEFVEEPTSGAALLELGPASVRWAVDESLANRALARALVGARGCSAVVLKPALVGGLLAARELAVEAFSLGRSVVVTHLFDGPVGLASACELALSLPVAPVACGLAPHAGLDAWRDVSVPHLATLPAVTSTGRAGLGLDGRSIFAGTP